MVKKNGSKNVEKKNIKRKGDVEKETHGRIKSELKNCIR
jgi:hypothetical protein